MSLTLSDQQADAMQKVKSWYEAGGDQFFYLAGYAGTGKTTVAHALIDEIGANPIYGAYTGKAASVMRASGCEDAATLHSIFYSFKQDPATGAYVQKLRSRTKSEPARADIIVIDECSMVDEKVGTDIMKFNKPVLVLGDPEQLPPVQGEGFFTRGEPDMMLTQIHRQAEGNPIIRMATTIREGGKLEYGMYGDSAVVSRSEFKAGFDVTEFDQVLVGKNKTRIDFNHRLRELKGFTDPMPQRGERLICLKNDRDLGIYNGGMFEVKTQTPQPDIHPEMIGMSVKPDGDDREISVLCRSEFFTGQRPPHWKELSGSQQFTFGYAMTVHKSQGSQWNRVVTFDEAFGTELERRRWRYTAITRAAKQIVWVQ